MINKTQLLTLCSLHLTGTTDPQQLMIIRDEKVTGTYCVLAVLVTQKAVTAGPSPCSLGVYYPVEVTDT